MSETTQNKQEGGRMVGTVLLLMLLALVVAAFAFGWFKDIAAKLPPLDWQGLTPELTVLLFAVLLPLVSLGNPDRRSIRQFALFGLGGGFALTAASLANAHMDELGNFQINFDWRYIGHTLGGVYSFTFASQLLKLVFLGAGFLAVLGMGRPLKGRSEEDLGEFLALLLFAVLGMMLVASSKDLIVLVLGIEMASMSSYLMAGMRRDAVGAEASLKYFTIGAISSSLMLFGVSLLYGMAGSTHFDVIASRVVSHGPFDVAMLLPIVFLLGGIGFKLSSVPFQAWAPDVYAGAPAPVAGLLASASKAMGLAAVVLVFLQALPGAKENWQLIVALVAAGSMFFGNLVALQQTNLRRMLAYSSIAQAGYLLIAVAAAGNTQDHGVWVVGGAVLHVIVNAAMKLGAFLAIGALLLAGVPDTLDGWKGLGRRAPLLSFAMVLFMLSMAGLPPMAGFQSKFLIFSGAIDAGVNLNYGWLTALAVIAVVNSAISLFYYLRVMRTMYVEPGPEGRVDVNVGSTIAVAVCALAILVIGVWPQPFTDASFHAARDLLGLSVAP